MFERLPSHQAIFGFVNHVGEFLLDQLAVGIRLEYGGIGRGTRLLAGLVSERGYAGMSLGVERGNVVSWGLYERARFMVVGDDGGVMLVTVAGLSGRRSGSSRSGSATLL